MKPTTGYLIWRLSMKWRAAVDREVASLGLTHAQYSLLASLSGLSRSGTRPSQRQLADATGLEPIYVSKLARALEKSGLIERPADPADPRAVRLTLTERGRHVVTEAIDRVHALFAEQLAPIGGPGGGPERALRDTLHTLLGETPLTTDESERTMTAPRTFNGRTINVAAAATRGILETLLSKEGLSFEDWVTLRAVATGQEVPSAVLGEDAVAAALTRLQSAGLLQSANEPTAEGRELFERITEAGDRVGDQLFEGIDAQDLAAAERVLDLVTERATAVRAQL